MTIREYKEKPLYFREHLLKESCRQHLHKAVSVLMKYCEDCDCMTRDLERAFSDITFEIDLSFK